MRLSDGDFEFLIETAAPEVIDKFSLKRIIREDEAFRNAFIGDEKVFKRLMDDEETLLKVSPTLFFEILLRKAADDLEKVSYTLEKTNHQKIPVFDSKEVVELLGKGSLLDYLAEMLSSFTEVESHTIPFRMENGSWEKIQFDNLDILSLMSLCEAADDEDRLGFYKRIADICLFILGICPEYAERDFRYPLSGQPRPQIRGKVRISPGDYEKEGRKYYKLAAEHQAAKELNLSEVFWALHGDFQKAKKPLNFIADHYLHRRWNKFFERY